MIMHIDDAQPPGAIAVTQEITVAKFKDLRKANRLVDLLSGCKIDATVAKKKNKYRVRVSAVASDKKYLAE